MPRRRRRENETDAVIDRDKLDREEAAADERPVRKARRARGPARWGRRLLLLGALLLVGLAILPNLIGWTGLHQRLIDWGAADFQGRVVVRQASLGWLQPIALTGIEAIDSAGQPLLSAEQIATSSSLLGLLTSRSPGTITVQRPVVHAALREGGSNLEDAIAKFVEAEPTDPDEPASPLPALQLLIQDGTIHLSTASNPVQTLTGFQASIQTAGASALAGEVEMQTGSPEAGPPAGSGGVPAVRSSLKLSLAIDKGAAALTGTGGDFSVDAKNFGLAVLAPAIERVLGQNLLQGNLTGQLTGSFDHGGAAARVEFQQLAVQGLKLGVQRLLGLDTFALNSLTAQGKAAINEGGIEATGLDLQCDVGNLRGEGKLDWKQLASLSQGQFAAAPFQLNGQVDLARLAAMLPRTLDLHNDLAIESGELKFNLASRTENNQPRLIANLDTLNLAGRRGTQRIVWQQPFRFAAALSQPGGQLMIEDLLCESDFLKVRGRGSLAAARFEATGDLAQLLERCRQFVSLEGWQLAGQLTGEINCKCEGTPVGNAQELLGRPIQITGEAKILNPVLQLPGVAPFAQPELRMALNATATAGPDGSVQISQGLGQLFLGTDTATARLTAPISSLSALTSLETEAGLTGELASWTSLVRNFVDIGNWNATGSVQASANVTANSRQMTARNLKFELKQLAFDGYAMQIREEQLSGTADLQVDLQSSSVSASQLTLVSSSIAAAGQNVRVAAGSTLDASGQIGFRGDVHRIAGWFGLSDPTDTVQYFGNLEGNLVLSSSPEFLLGTLQAVVKDMVAAQPDFQNQKWVELVREAQLQVGGKLGLAQNFNDLKLDGLQIGSHAVSAQVNGLIRDLAGRFDMQLDGSWSPDWKQVDGLIQAYAGDYVHLTGRDQQAFTIRGPLFEPASAGAAATALLPASTQVATELKWESGNVFLLPVGPARISAGLNGSVARIDTGEIDFGGGKVSLRPEVDLSAAAPVVQMPAGTIASRVQLSPEFCRDWMKYVAPLLADVTTAEGSFSVRTEGLTMPISNPAGLQTRGAVTLHNVTVGAGPLGQQLLEAVQSVRSILKPEAASRDRSVWMNLGEQEIPFAVQDGRVYHEGLRLQIKDLQVTTRGSVGMDQSLQMVAVIPIHDDWLNGQRWLEGLRGQSLEIPVTGTVSKPVLDKRAIQQLTIQLGQRVAQQEINRVVGEQTQKLQDKATEELNQFQQKIQGKLQSEVKDKFQGELRKGLDSLFGPPPSSSPTPPPSTGTPPTGGGG